MSHLAERADLRTVTDASFADSVLASERPVVLDFWAEWCPHCPAMARALADLAPELGDRVLLATIDYDANPEVGRAYRIMSLPTLLVFRDGEVVGTIVGARPKSRLRQSILDLIER
jgi:thioredoxin 1